MYRIILITSFFCLLCNVVFAQYRKIDFPCLLRNSVSKKDNIFLKKYNYHVYCYQDYDLLLYPTLFKKTKNIFHISPSTKLIIYQNRVRGNFENYHLIETNPEIYILLLEIRIISIKGNRILFETSYYESSHKDILPDIRIGKGIIQYRLDRHLVRIDTIAFEWNTKKKKWFVINNK